MNLGQLTADNEEFINDYKRFGYKTKTQMANEAFAMLRAAKKREDRAAWREEAFSELAGTKPDIAFEAIEGEDFEGKAG
ncbi:MAG: hypothetical protein M3Q07_19505 [Pseudobdellovibrionaceae bacterium]|nr:hypothetical protein [Pseudobdellovibrionaceae bacterium]